MLMSLFMLVCSANAQIKDDIQKSKERAAKLQALCNDYKTSGSANVDGYGELQRRMPQFWRLPTVYNWKICTNEKLVKLKMV